MRKNNKFKPGQSGNPDGRPKGSKDKRTSYRELFEPHAEALIDKAVTMAIEGDTTMIRLCIDRIVSPYRAVDPPVKLDGFKGSLAEKGEQIINAALQDGALTASEAASLLQALAAQARIVEVDDLEKRVKTLEGNNVN